MDGTTQMKDESKVTDAARAGVGERGRDRRAGRGIGIVLAGVAVAGAMGFATWYARYDAPFYRGAEPEWMADVSEDSVGALIGMAAVIFFGGILTTSLISISERQREIATQVGMFLLISIMGFALYNDIHRLVVG